MINVTNKSADSLCIQSKMTVVYCTTEFLTVRSIFGRHAQNFSKTVVMKSGLTSQSKYQYFYTSLINVIQLVNCEHYIQESCAIAKITVRCASYMSALKVFEYT